MTTQYWIVKSEPDTYGWDQFAAEKRTDWTGVRNFAARKHLQAMQKGDEVLFYETGDTRAIRGRAIVSRTSFPDPTADEDGWVAVELKAGPQLPQPVPLATIKGEKSLAGLALVRQGRLSVSPVSAREFAALLKLGDT